MSEGMSGRMDFTSHMLVLALGVYSSWLRASSLGARQCTSFAMSGSISNKGGGKDKGKGGGSNDANDLPVAKTAL